jgi:hypothetical protein
MCGHSLQWCVVPAYGVAAGGATAEHAGDDFMIANRAAPPQKSAWSAITHAGKKHHGE